VELESALPPGHAIAIAHSANRITYLRPPLPRSVIVHRGNLQQSAQQVEVEGLDEHDSPNLGVDLSEVTVSIGKADSYPVCLSTNKLTNHAMALTSLTSYRSIICKPPSRPLN
jgi:hypothetical protein